MYVSLNCTLNCYRIVYEKKKTYNTLMTYQNNKCGTSNYYMSVTKNQKH